MTLVRRRRRVRRPRGPVDADPRLPAGAAHRQAGEDRLQPLRVLLRPRPPPPGQAALRARRHPGRQAHPREVPDRAGRRRLRLRLPGRRRQRRLPRRSGPYVVDDVDIEALALYTNNPPCGAMRGFGAVQACFAYEAQMDRLAAELGMDPVEFRQRNAMAQGTVLPTGQEVDSPAPVAEILRRVKAMPLPPERQWETGRRGTRRRAGAARRAVQHHARRRRGARGRLRGRHQERRLLRGVRRLLHRPGPPRGGRRRAGRHGAHRDGRGRPGRRHRARPDRPHRTRRRPR